MELVRRSLVFNEEAHQLFPPGFRRAVRHVLGLKVALDRTQPSIAFSRMPSALWMVVLEKLDRNYALERCLDIERSLNTEDPEVLQALAMAQKAAEVLHSQTAAHANATRIRQYNHRS